VPADDRASCWTLSVMEIVRECCFDDDEAAGENDTVDAGHHLGNR